MEICLTCVGSDSKQGTITEVVTCNLLQASVLVKRFWRPEDICWDLAYSTSFEEIYADAGPDVAVSLDDVVGTCSVLQATPEQPLGASP